MKYDKVENLQILSKYIHEVKVVDVLIKVVSSSYLSYEFPVLTRHRAGTYHPYGGYYDDPIEGYNFIEVAEYILQNQDKKKESLKKSFSKGLF